MNFNTHSNLEGAHAFLGASKYHWINYDEDKVIDVYNKFQATLRGTRLHDYAAESIRLRQKLPRSKKTLNMFVNDAVGYRMIPEQVLFYSFNCFGTADAISFTNNVLRIHDLKTGQTPAKIEQLLIYSALFCLEYNQNPDDIDIELRIYQHDEILVYEPEEGEIRHIMDKIVEFDKVLKRIQLEER